MRIVGLTTSVLLAVFAFVLLPGPPVLAQTVSEVNIVIEVPFVDIDTVEVALLSNDVDVTARDCGAPTPSTDAPAGERYVVMCFTTPDTELSIEVKVASGSHLAMRCIEPLADPVVELDPAGFVSNLSECRITAVPQGILIDSEADPIEHQLISVPGRTVTCVAIAPVPQFASRAHCAVAEGVYSFEPTATHAADELIVPCRSAATGQTMDGLEGVTVWAGDPLWVCGDFVEAPAEPAAVIGVEWMDTAGLGGTVPWMSTLTVVVTASDGTDVSDQCVTGGDLEQPGFRRVEFRCFDLGDGVYDVEVVGIPDDETPTSTCTSVAVPGPPTDDGTYCLWSFFSAGVVPATPTTSTTPTASTTPTTSSPTTDLPETGQTNGQLAVVAMAFFAGGAILLAAAGRPLRRPGGRSSRSAE